MKSIAAHAAQTAKILNFGLPVEAEKAVGEFSQAHPDGVGLHCRLADIAMRTLRPSLAVELMRQAIAAAPNNTILHSNLGVTLQQAGRLAEAVDCFRNALKLAPYSHEAKIGLANALEELGDWAEARRIRASVGLEVPVIYRLPSARANAVVITIDDGPSPEVTPRLLDVLRLARTKASFFVIGERAAAHPALINDIVAEGHDVFSHGYSHRSFAEPGVDPIAELDATEAVLSQHRPPPSPYWIRPPFGAGTDDPSLHRRLRAWRPDVVLASWSRCFFDWHIPDRCFGLAGLPVVCAETVAQTMAAPPQSGTIFLLHDLPVDASRPLAAHVGEPLLQSLLDALAVRKMVGASLSELAESFS